MGGAGTSCPVPAPQGPRSQDPEVLPLRPLRGTPGFQDENASAKLPSPPAPGRSLLTIPNPAPGTRVSVGSRGYRPLWASQALCRHTLTSRLFPRGLRQTSLPHGSLLSPRLTCANDPAPAAGAGEGRPCLLFPGWPWPRSGSRARGRSASVSGTGLRAEASALRLSIGPWRPAGASSGNA